MAMTRAAQGYHSAFLPNYPHTAVLHSTMVPVYNGLLMMGGEGLFETDVVVIPSTFELLEVQQLS
jgi:selenophosphate synthetase-related protein